MQAGNTIIANIVPKKEGLPGDRINLVLEGLTPGSASDVKVQVIKNTAEIAKHESAISSLEKKEKKTEAQVAANKDALDYKANLHYATEYATYDIAQGNSGMGFKTKNDDGTSASLHVFDGHSEEDGAFLQIAAGGMSGPHITVKQDKAYYDNSPYKHEDKNEIAVKGDVASLKEETTSLLNNKADKEELDKRTVQEISGDKGTSRIENHDNGGVMTFVTKDNKRGGVAVNDGTENILTELYAVNGDNKNGSRLIMNENGAYYTKGDKVSYEENNEIATKEDVDNLREISQSKARISTVDPGEGSELGDGEILIVVSEEE